MCFSGGTDVGRRVGELTMVMVVMVRSSILRVK